MPAPNAEVIELAKRALAFQKAFAVYFPDPAREMGDLAARILTSLGVHYWLSPRGDSITCVSCRLTSNHPTDVAEKYCGACRRFLDSI
jgi:hypothetical protein